MLEKTIEYVKEFISDPRNQKLINHEQSALRNAKELVKLKVLRLANLM